MKKQYAELWHTLPGGMFLAHYAVIAGLIVGVLLVRAPLIGLFGFLAWLISIISLMQLCLIIDSLQ